METPQNKIKLIAETPIELIAMALYFYPMNITQCDNERLKELWTFADRSDYFAKADFILSVLNQ